MSRVWWNIKMKIGRSLVGECNNISILIDVDYQVKGINIISQTFISPLQLTISIDFVDKFNKISLVPSQIPNLSLINLFRNGRCGSHLGIIYVHSTYAQYNMVYAPGQLVPMGALQVYNQQVSSSWKDFCYNNSCSVGKSFTILFNLICNEGHICCQCSYTMRWNCR